jgi:hypothetical protein
MVTVVTPQEMLDDLARVGVEIRDVYDLVNTKAKYPDAVPVLIAWLDRVDDLPGSTEREHLREGILRALTVKEARPAAALPVIRQFSVMPEPAGLGMGWVAANALGVVADHTVADEIIALMLDRSLGRAREMLFEAVPRIAKRRPDIVETVRSLLDDEDVRAFVIMALGRLGDAKSRSAIASFADSDHALTRKQVPIALRRIDAAAST